MAAFLVPVEVLDRLAQATLELARAIVAEGYQTDFGFLSRELLRRLWDGVELAERGRVFYDKGLRVFYVYGMPSKLGKGIRYMVRPGECECGDHTWKAPKGRCKHIAAVNAIVATGRFYQTEEELDEVYRAESQKFDVAFARDVLEERDFFV